MAALFLCSGHRLSSKPDVVLFDMFYDVTCKSIFRISLKLVCPVFSFSPHFRSIVFFDAARDRKRNQWVREPDLLLMLMKGDRVTARQTKEQTKNSTTQTWNLHIVNYKSRYLDMLRGGEGGDSEPLPSQKHTPAARVCVYVCMYVCVLKWCTNNYNLALRT